MITVICAVVGFFLAIGVLLGLGIFTVGAIGTVIVYGIKLGICLIPVAIGVFFAKILFGI